MRSTASNVFLLHPGRYDPTTNQPYPWLEQAGSTGVNDFSAFFLPENFP